jgi:hypothetical protein
MMGFLRRILGTSPAPAPDAAADTAPVDEAARERELLLEEARRLDDDLIQRQLRYADRAWTPPPQGGTRRADDEDPEDRGEPG